MKSVDIIWNITRLCPWDCKVCCVDAHAVRANGDKLQIESNEVQTTLIRSTTEPLFEQALRSLQKSGHELTLEKKMRVIEHLKGFDVALDFSGGDPLFISDTLHIIRYARHVLAGAKITLTSTGKALTIDNATRLAGLIDELNFTYDSPLKDGGETRPDGYASVNLAKADVFMKCGIPVRAECPLSLDNSAPDQLVRIYRDLHTAGVATLLLMRLFPVGRAASVSEQIPSPDQYREAIKCLRAEEARLGTPVLKLQCALRAFDSATLTQNPCDLISKSFGLMPDGTLLASAWAYGASGKPLGDEWVLGDLSKTPLTEILESPKVREYVQRLNENFGHCKIHAWAHSTHSVQADRLFDKTDPLLQTLN